MCLHKMQLTSYQLYANCGEIKYCLNQACTILASICITFHFVLTFIKMFLDYTISASHSTHKMGEHEKCREVFKYKILDTLSSLHL